MANIQNALRKPAQLQTEKVLKLWRHRPKIFLRDAMDMELDLWQEECLELYMNHQRLGMIASKGVGKTAFLSAVGWHFFLTQYRPKMAALSVTKEHLMMGLWAELLMRRERSKLLTLSTTDGQQKIALKGHEGYSFIAARSYPKSANEDQMASSLAGIHADNVAFLIDEGGTIPDAIYSTASGALTTGVGKTTNSKLIVTANPEEPKGVLYRAARGDSEEEWAIYRVSGDPEDPKRAHRVDLKWAKEQIKAYGRDDPWVMVNVLGQYPKTSSTMLITEDEIDMAMKRTIDEKQVRAHQRRLGIDVSRGGVDSTAIVERQGLKVFPIETVPSSVYGPELAGKVALRATENRVERVFVDNTGGYGSSVIDSLSMFPAIDVTPVVYNANAQDKRYFNKRTEMWVRMRDAIRAGLCLPLDNELRKELLMPKLFFIGGVFRLEDKAQIKARLGRSPDRADALAQTYADIEQPSMYYDNSGTNTPGSARIGGTYGQIMHGRHYADESQVDDYYMPSPNFRS